MPDVNKIGQKMADIPLKGQWSLCLTFDRKGHETKLEPMQISYMHAKFEQN